MAENPLKKYEDELLQRDEKRQEWLKRQERSRPSQKALAGMAVGAAVAAGIHLATPGGLVGQAASIAKKTGAARRALSRATQKTGGRQAFTGPLQYRGLRPKQYAQDMTDFVTRTAPEIKSRAHKFKGEFAQQYKKEMSGIREIDIGQRAREINEATENVAMRYRADRARPRIEEELQQIAQQGEESSRAVQQLKKQLEHNIDDFTIKYGGQARTDRLIRAGLQQESAQEISHRLGQIKQDVMSDTAGMDFEQLENRLRDIMVEQQARTRMDTQEMGFVPRMLKEGRELIEQGLGYRKATAADLTSSDFKIPDHLDVHERALNLIDDIKSMGFDPQDISVDPDLLVRQGTGKMIDAGLITQELGALRGQFADGLLGSITFQRDQMLAKEFSKKAVHEMKGGYHQPVLAGTDVVGDDLRLQETLYGIGDTAYRISHEGDEFGLEAMRSGLDFTSGRYGATKRLLRTMSGVDAPDYGREDAPLWEQAVGEQLDISAKAPPGGFTKTKSIFTKSRDPQWMQNKFQRALSDTQRGDLSRRQALELRQYIQEHTASAPEDLIYRLGQETSYEGVLDLSSREQMVQTYTDLFQHRGLDQTGIGREAIESRAHDIMGRTRTVSDRRIFSKAQLQTGEDLLQKEISDMIIQEAGPNNAQQIVGQMLQDGELIVDQKQRAIEAITSGVIEEGFRQSTVENVGPISQALQSEASTIQRLLDSTHPRGLGYGPTDFESLWRSDTLALSQFNLGPHNLFDTFFAGRNNLENVHRGTLYAFNIPNRLNQLMRNVDVLPFQMTDESMTSPIGAMGNFMARRVLPLYAGYEAFSYMDDHAKDYTGYTISQHYQRAQAHTRFGVAGIKENLGLDRLMEQVDYATPGSEGIEEFLTHTPITGATFPMAAAGKAARFTGAFSTRDREEWQEYYEHEMEPVRRGQHWLLGMQPWMGDGITHFEPNPYQDAMSEWQYTDTVYGDRENYWQHRPYPTPRAPLSPIRRFVTNRYWWEDMHEERRPYPVSGPMFDPDTAWGSLLNPTLGRAMKPQREYTEGADREEIDDYAPPRIPFGRYTRGDLHVQEITPDYMLSENMAARLQMPGWTGQERAEGLIAAPDRRQAHRVRTEEIEGESVLVDELTGTVIMPENIETETNEIVNLPLGRETGGGIPVAQGQPGEAMGEPRGNIRYIESEMTRGPLNVPGGHKINVTDEDHEARLLARDNEYPMSDVRALARAVSSADYNQGIQEIEGNIRDMGPVIGGGREFEEETPMEVRHPGSLDYQADRIRYIWGLRMPGIRGYLSNIAFFGGDDFGAGTATLADASEAYGRTARFYRSGIGGRGGAFSEVFRRFFQRTPGLEQRVNTLPNTMPNWMPEELQTGDPYCVSPDTLIELNQGELKRADEVMIGDTITTHKGNKLPVKDLAYRQVEKGEDVYEITVSSLSAFPFKVSEEHPLLVVNEKNKINNSINTNRYEKANEILETYDGLIEDTNDDISNKLNTSPVSISRAMKLLRKHNKAIKIGQKHKIIDNSRIDIETIIDKSYREKTNYENIDWKEVQDVSVGDYVAYPLPQEGTEEFILDLSDYLEEESYVFTNEYCYYTVDKEYAEIYEYVEQNKDKKYKYGERKKLLEEKGWPARRFEKAQECIREGYSSFRVPRFIPVNEDFNRVAGYYIAEGSITNGSIGFASHSDEIEYRKQIIDAFNNLFERNIVSNYSREGNGHALSIGIKPIAKLFKKLFGVYAENKQIPEFMFEQKKKLNSILLKSLINADGCSFTSDGRDRISYTTISEKLAYQIRLLALQFRAVGGIIKEKEKTVTVKSGPSKGKIFNQKASFMVNFDGPAAHKIAEVINYDHISGSKNMNNTKWKIDENYLYLRVNKKKKTKGTETVIGFEVGTDNSFCVLGVATHNTELPGGEYRLPGEAYESMSTLFPDRFGQYGAVDRASILADVAPWSDEFDYWLTIAQSQELPEDAEDKLQRALERSREQQGRYHFTEYEYLHNNVESATVTVDQFIDQDRFTVNELDRPLRIAGVYGTFDTETEEGQAMVDVLSEYMLPGEEITIRYEDREDQEATSPAVIYSRGQNINNMLKEYGVTPHEEQGDIEPYLYAHPYARAIGGLWERMVRTDIPIVRTRITNVYSPFEHYRENNLYGMQFQNWQEPYQQVVKPNFQAFAARNPLGAAMGGAGTGAIAGGLLFGRSGFKTGALLGAAAATGGSFWRMAKEFRTGEAWIPERRQTQREIEEYYDRLEYLKNKRLYQKYSELAEQEEDIDLEQTIAEMRGVEEEVDSLQNRVDDLTRKIQQDRVYEGQAYVQMVNAEGRIEYRPVTDRTVMEQIREQAGLDEIGQLEENELITNLGPYARRALKYRQEKRATMYGLDQNATVTEIMRALPSSEREYFPEFLEIEDEDRREEILRVVPDDMARALNMMWGQEYEEPEPIEEFFEDYYLPDKDWIGWREQVDLEHSQIKTIENVGKDPKDFGIWRNYSKAEKLTPTPYTPWEGESYEDPNPDITSIRNQLEIILKEYDIENADIEIHPQKKSGIDINVDITEDLRPQAETQITKMLTG